MTRPEENEMTSKEARSQGKQASTASGSGQGEQPMADLQQGPPLAPKACTHDSTRADGWLDNCCLRCGADGYWKAGYRAAEVEIHPSGKPLVKVAAWLADDSDA